MRAGVRHHGGGGPVTQPQDLPADPEARGSQIHSNVTSYLQAMIEDTALTLRGPFAASAIAGEICGKAMRSDPAVVASVFAAAVVLLAEQHNGDNGLEKIKTEFPDVDLPDDATTTRDRSARFCLALNELLFTHGLLIGSVLDMEIQDPVKGTVVAQGLRYDTKTARYACQAAPPHQWQIP
jgi:hypothetical protein